MADLGTRLALEDDALTATTDAATAAVQVRVLVTRAVNVVVFILILIFGVVRTGDSGRGSCCGATAVERGDERWRLAPGDDEQSRRRAFHEAMRQRVGRVESLSAGKLRWVVSGGSSGDAE